MSRRFFAGFALACVAGCSTASTSDPLCTCGDDEKFDGEACVPSAEFTAPACTDDDIQVCGCDGANYTSMCAAYAVGVEVKYAGPCRSTGSGSGGGGFGW